MTSRAALKADQARIWGAASWQYIAERQLFPVHDELVASTRDLESAGSISRLGPGPWRCVLRGRGPTSARRTWRPS